MKISEFRKLIREEVRKVKVTEIASMTNQEILDGIDKAIDVMLTYDQDTPTKKIIKALQSAWDKISDDEEGKDSYPWGR